MKTNSHPVTRTSMTSPLPDILSRRFRKQITFQIFVWLGHFYKVFKQYVGVIRGSYRETTKRSECE